MFNKTNDYKNIEIAKIIQAIAAERKINVEKVFQVTKFSLLEVFAHIYGKAKLDIDINKNSSEISVMQCCKVVSDEDAKSQKYFYIEKKEEPVEEQEENKSSDILSRYKDNLVGGQSNFLESHVKKIEEDDTMHFSTIGITEAKKYLPNIEIGETMKLPIPNAWQNLENNNKLARFFNKSFFRFIDTLIKEQEVIFFSKKENQMLNVFVKSANKDGYVLTYDNYDIILPADPKSNKDNKDGKENPNDKYKYSSGLKSEVIPGEYFGKGERVQVFIKMNKNKFDEKNIEKKLKYQIIASRTHPGFLSELLKQSVPEIRDEQILIKDVQRIPGIRAKVVVFSTDPNLDPVGSCIGVRGVRIKGISQELKGERIDIINYSENLFELAANAIHPIKIMKITENYDEHIGKLIITVDDKDLSFAIGKGGSNIKLLSRILKYKIEIIGSMVEESRRVTEYQVMLENFKNALDIEDIIAQILIMNNFKTIEDLAYAELSNLLQIEYFDEELASELQNRALEYIYDQEQKELEKVDIQLRDLLKNFDNEDGDLLKAFLEKEIFTISKLAEFDIEELMEKFEDSCEDITEEFAEELIIAARKAIDFKI